MEKKVAFVTGANGFVGSHLVEYLIEQRMEVHCLMRATSNDKWLKGLDVTIHREGLMNQEYLHQQFKKHTANYIFHLAGTVNGKNYDDFVNGNVKPTESILNASLGVKSIEKIMITSSLAASRATTLGSPNDENCERKPLTDYGISKVQQEDVSRKYMDRLPICIVRPPIVYGERDTEVLLFFKTVKFHLTPLIGFTDKSISIVYVRDLVQGMYKVTVSQNTQGELFFLGGEKDEYTWDEIGELTKNILDTWAIKLKVPHTIVRLVSFVSEMIGKLTGKGTTFNTQKAREMTSESWSCTSDKAKKMAGYRPEFSIEKGFKKTIYWYKAEKWL